MILLLEEAEKSIKAFTSLLHADDVEAVTIHLQDDLDASIGEAGGERLHPLTSNVSISPGNEYKYTANGLRRKRQKVEPIAHESEAARRETIGEIPGLRQSRERPCRIPDPPAERDPEPP